MPVFDKAKKHSRNSLLASEASIDVAKQEHKTRAVVCSRMVLLAIPLETVPVVEILISNTCKQYIDSHIVICMEVDTKHTRHDCED